MSGYVAGVDRQQAGMFPETLDDFVGPNNSVRVIDAFVDGLNLQELGFERAVPAARGRPGYDPRVLTKLFIYGYLNRTRSSRRLEREARRNVEVMWLTGRQAPDYRTIADFRATHATRFKQVFRQFTVVCASLDLFGGELLVVDGTKILASNGKHRSFSAAQLQTLLQGIDARITEYLALLETTDRADEGTEPTSAAVPDLSAKLAQLTTRQDDYRALLATMEETGTTQVTLTDPESRRMKVKQGIEVAYNAQIAVDAKHHLLVAVDVTNEVNDLHQLQPMAQAAKAALGVETLTVLADAGYFHGPQVVACVEDGILPVVPPIKSSKNARAGLFTKADFQYDPATDTYRCPGEQTLPFVFEATEDGEGQRYYYDFAACRDCVLRPQCTKESNPTRGRRIQRWAKEAVLEAMATRRQAMPDAMLRRKSIVEHPFGTIKRWDDGGYFLLRGLKKVGGEFSLMALAYNMRRALNLVGISALTGAIARLTIPAAEAATG
jgi:transposase